MQTQIQFWPTFWAMFWPTLTAVGITILTALAVVIVACYPAWRATRRGIAYGTPPWFPFLRRWRRWVILAIPLVVVPLILLHYLVTAQVVLGLTLALWFLGIPMPVWPLRRARS
jgi:hypothetical protein